MYKQHYSKSFFLNFLLLSFEKFMKMKLSGCSSGPFNWYIDDCHIDNKGTD